MINTQIENKLAHFLDGYKELFGEVPPIPRERLELGMTLAPEFTELAEAVRNSAFHGGALDDKTAQLICFAFLACKSGPGAYWHARAARLYGASWPEIMQALELSFFFNGAGAINHGMMTLSKLYKEETGAGEAA